MSGFGFLDDELKEAAGGRPGAGGAGGRSLPPSEWSAAKTRSQFEDQTYVADRAGPAGGGGGGGGAESALQDPRGADHPEGHRQPTGLRGRQAED
eukprot:CAMPEP_0176181486 /NCGR_PEP_ID=MMETSP0120_2-20121206/92989_1 /TAXON_ID=160619 /ORGANISM="Kryptoperidinium foliaceum, Strain CCMP 1326" /LENGTH=94 /DNA_ID=CAMNT_0017519711 /DNA_START=69 /DNA_END=352 /DNA_ORIENTATION=+